MEKLPRDEHREFVERPEIRSDNGSGYIWRKFAEVADEYGLSHRRIKRHCTEEKELDERVPSVQKAIS